ncbi:hypothetical protein PTKIN_Ptkin14bG0050800 [Pterospermum kingtungense]
MEDSPNSIVEERTELMVSPAGKNLKLRNAHFITPSIGLGPVDEKLVANVPSNCLSSLPTTFEPKKWPLEVNFCGWRYPQRNWETWVSKMASLHESTWKKAGIFEAIMNSMYKIERNNDFVFGVAEKWCHETQSFVFSWEEMRDTWEKLEDARKEFIQGSSKKVHHSPWMRKFMNSDSQIEHEAFLALWLSRFVLPTCYDVVVKSVFPIAIHLARGTRIALAPAVLANIYRDLSWLKQNIVASTQLESNCNDQNIELAITISSPLTLVQVWVWERFLDFRPKPNLIESGEPRLALWHGLKCKVQNVRSVLDSAKERFDWRPYVWKITNWDGPKFCGDKAMWICIDSSLEDENLLSFARCLRASELVGLDCIEQYLPHRVALQFGMDQDIPGLVPRSNDSPEIAWSDYNKSADGDKLYIPSRLFKADVTTRYSDWWKQSMLSLQERSKDVLEEQRKFSSFRITPKRKKGIEGSDVFTSFKMIPKSLKRRREDDTCISFEVMPKKFKGIREGSSASIQSDIYLKSLRRSGKGNNATSDLGSSLKRSGKLAQYAKWKMAVRNAGFVARSSERKKKGNNASILPHELPPMSSKGLAVSTEVKNEGLPPKRNMLRANDSVNEDMVTPSVPPGFTPKCKVLEAKSSIHKDNETTLIHPGFASKHVDEVTPLVPPGFPPKCDMVMVEPKVTVDEGKDNRKTLEVSDFVRDEVTERSACNHESVGNRSLSSDPHDEDQLTITEMLKSNQKPDNVNCRDAGENSSGHCQSFSSLIADNELPISMEPITALGSEKLMPAEAGTRGTKGATHTIQDEIGSNGGRPADKTVGNNGMVTPGYGNSCLDEISSLNLEARISRLERLVAEKKAARKGKSVVRAWVDLV